MALAIVGAIVLVAPLSAYASEGVGWMKGLLEVATVAVQQSCDAVDGGDAQDVCDDDASAEIAGCLGFNGGAQTVPEEFYEECIAFAGPCEAMDLQGGLLVGFAANSTSEQEFSQIKDELVAKGWTWAESGRSNAGTFLKETGAYRWLFVSCVEVSGSASVTVQAMKGDKG